MLSSPTGLNICFASHVLTLPKSINENHQLESRSQPHAHASLPPESYPPQHPSPLLPWKSTCRYLLTHTPCCQVWPGIPHWASSSMEVPRTPGHARPPTWNTEVMAEALLGIGTTKTRATVTLHFIFKTREKITFTGSQPWNPQSLAPLLFIWSQSLI